MISETSYTLPYLTKSQLSLVDYKLYCSEGIHFNSQFFWKVTKVQVGGNKRKHRQANQPNHGMFFCRSACSSSYPGCFSQQHHKSS